MACAAGACEVVRSGWTALRQRRVARYREPGRWLQRGSRKKTRWEGRLQPSDSKRAARSEGSRRPHRPGREAPDQPGSQTQRSPSRNAAQPPRRVLRVPLSHLDSGEGPDPRSQGQPVEEADSNRAKVTEPFPAGQNGGSPARRHPGGRTRLRTRGGGVGRGGVWEPVKEAELCSPLARSSLTRPRAGPGPSARLQVPEGRAARAGRGRSLARSLFLWHITEVPKHQILGAPQPARWGKFFKGRSTLQSEMAALASPSATLNLQLLVTS